MKPCTSSPVPRQFGKYVLPLPRSPDALPVLRVKTQCRLDQIELLGNEVLPKLR
jgi:hypothetical protein